MRAYPFSGAVRVQIDLGLAIDVDLFQRKWEIDCEAIMRLVRLCGDAELLEILTVSRQKPDS
jgi:hypothetical protein